LAHVVQQRAGRVRNPLGSGLAVVQDKALEAEADRLGRQAAAHRVKVQAKLIRGAVQPSSTVRISSRQSDTTASRTEPRTNRVIGPTSGMAVQRIKAKYTKARKTVWNNQDEPDFVYYNQLSHWVSSFSDSLVIDQTHGVITQAQQGSALWIEGHSELFLEYLDHQQQGVIKRIHYTKGVISIAAYRTDGEDWRTRLPRGSSWRVTKQKIDDALEAARSLQEKFSSGALEYSQLFGTTNWAHATTSEKVKMNCKDVTDAILIEVGVLRGRKAWFHSFNSPKNIAGHHNRNSVPPDDKWVD
jgi:hypothetical protein